MKKKITLLSTFMLLLGTSFGQIIGSVNGDTPVNGPITNSGIAIGPYYQFQAIVYDDATLSSYKIEWRDNTGVVWDGDSRAGSNPDVAYYANVDACAVAYESGGAIVVDDYYLLNLATIDYGYNTSTPVAMGTNPNIDMNSVGNGVLCWEDGGNVFACTFNIGTFAAGPPVFISSGGQPDIVLLDNDNEVVIALVSGGQLRVATLDHASLAAGFASFITGASFPPMGSYESPRIASQRNATFGPDNYYTVVVQDNLGGNMYNVDGYFEFGAGLTGPTLINTAVNNCGNLAPKPVVTYNLGLVDIAWAQRYSNSCAGALFPAGQRDVLMAECDFAGNNVNGFTTFLEVNQNPLNFMGSATSLNSEYDGNYSVNNTNYCEGIVFSDPSLLYWKKRDLLVPAFKVGETEVASIVKGAAEMQIQVTMNLETEEQMTFVLYDASGRMIDIPQISQEGSNYTLDASQLTDGIYLLNCMVGDQKTVARIPHFTN